MATPSSLVDFNDTTPVSDDDLYRQGSQYRIWSFSQSDLSELRKSVNEIAAENLQYENSTSGLAPDLVPSASAYLTSDEEYDLLLHYSVKLQEASAVYKLPSHIKATAISYMKRFYLKYSLMEYHPHNIMYTCLFLATKSENHFISIDNFIAPLQHVSTKAILDLEFVVSQALSFTLLVHHAFAPIHGYFLDLQTLFPTRLDEIGSAHDKARKFANDSLFSDAQFLYTPPQIALAALALSNSDLMDKYLLKKFEDHPLLLHQLTQTITKIKPFILAGSQRISTDRASSLELKLFICRNPAKAAAAVAKKRKVSTSDNTSPPVQIPINTSSLSSQLRSTSPLESPTKRARTAGSAAIASPSRDVVMSES
ncbi:cyclin-like protein [Lipomyces oligophaga]|uniref:cyclin-like protein n=1 Tax=Lipomyces oligophaga TaxID=45792 RepID=UPI0034CDA4E3